MGDGAVLQATGPVATDFYDCALPVAQRFGVMSLPTVLILRAGKEVERPDRLIRNGNLKAAFERALRA